MNSIEKAAQEYASQFTYSQDRLLATMAFLSGSSYLSTNLTSFLTHLCDTNVIDCHSAEEIVKKWEDWERK